MNGGVLITGATGIIGKTIALELAKKQIPLIIHGRSRDKLQLLNSELLSLGTRAEFIFSDICEPGVISSLLIEAAATFDGLLGIVNCAGFFNDFTCEQLTDSESDALLHTNFTALAQLCLQAIPFLEGVPEAFLINISSVAGKQLLPESPMYCASKFAVFGFSQSLFERIRRKGIRVSVIGPGQVSNVREQDSGECSIPSSDVARLVSFLMDFSMCSCITEVSIKPLGR